MYHHYKNGHFNFDILCKVKFTLLMFSAYLVTFMSLRLLFIDFENIRDCELKYNIPG